MPHITHELKALSNPVYTINRDFIRNHSLEVDLVPLPYGFTSTGYRVGTIAISNRPLVRNPVTSLYELANDPNPVLLDGRNYHEIRTTVLEELERLNIISTDGFTNITHPHISRHPRPVNPTTFTHYERYCTHIPTIASGTIDLVEPISFDEHNLPLLTSIPIELAPLGRVQIYEDIPVVQPNVAPFRRPTFFQECMRFHHKTAHNLVTLYHTLRESHETGLFPTPQAAAPAAALQNHSPIRIRSSLNQLL